MELFVDTISIGEDMTRSMNHSAMNTEGFMINLKPKNIGKILVFAKLTFFNDLRRKSGCGKAHLTFDGGRGGVWWEEVAFLKFYAV